MTDSPPRNWILKLALAVLGGCVAALGVFAWADAARFFEARAAHALGSAEFVAALHPLWPVFAIACVGCVAAQIFAACATINFARLAKAPKIWRGLCGAFYVVSVVFAAYSADKGAQIIIGLPHRAAYEAREADRKRLTDEIADIDERMAEARRQLLSYDPATTPTARQNAAREAFNLRTESDARRLPIVQNELDARPPIARERQPEGWEAAVFFIFLLWAALEPWGYPLADRGRVEMPGRVRPKASPFRPKQPRIVRPSFWWRVLATLGLVNVASAAAEPPPPPDHGQAASPRTPLRAQPVREPATRAQPGPLREATEAERTEARDLLAKGRAPLEVTRHFAARGVLMPHGSTKRWNSELRQRVPA